MYESSYRISRDMYEEYKKMMLSDRLQVIITFFVGLLLLGATILLRSDFIHSREVRWLSQRIEELESEVRYLDVRWQTDVQSPAEVDRLVASVDQLVASVDELSGHVETIVQRPAEDDDHLFYFMAFMSGMMLLGSVVPGMFFRARFGHEMLREMEKRFMVPDQ